LDIFFKGKRNKGKRKKREKTKKPSTLIGMRKKELKRKGPKRGPLRKARRGIKGKRTLGGLGKEEKENPKPLSNAKKEPAEPLTILFFSAPFGANGETK
jgi:hypothetical protein